MDSDDQCDEKVLIKPGAFNRKLDVRENVVMAVLSPYLAIAVAMARPSWIKRRIDWGKLYNVPEKRGGFSIAGPAVGAPTAVNMLETLIANGARRVIVTGCCGSINRDVQIGDILVPTSAVSEEGTSAHYRPDMFPPVADKELTAVVESEASARGLNFHKGPVWTTDAPYRETCAKVEKHGRDGVLGVEMELSALFTVARFRGVKLAAVLAVSDELALLEWKPGFLKPAFLKTTKNVIAISLSAARSG